MKRSDFNKDEWVEDLSTLDQSLDNLIKERDELKRQIIQLKHQQALWDAERESLEKEIIGLSGWDTASKTDNQ